MAAVHPYISGPGNIAHMINHLRSNFPSVVNLDTVKKLGLAPKNESYVINALHFVDMIDKDNKKTEAAAQVFSAHKDEDFQTKFGSMVEKAYSQLFDLHSDNAWKLNKEELITFFRNADQTSNAIGSRQAGTFLVFAALSGHGTQPTQKTLKAKNIRLDGKARPKKALSEKGDNSKKADKLVTNINDFGLSVKIEINLPSDATAETYDNIFQSIRKNLING